MGQFICIKTAMGLFQREKLYYATTYSKLKPRRKFNYSFLDNADKTKCN